MQASKVFFAASFSLAASAIAGCGFQRVPFQPIPVATTPSEKLEGNWLIYGSMPRFDVPLAGPNPRPGLALSLSSDGKTIAGAAFLSGTCENGQTVSIIFGNGVTATPDATGHFVTSSTQTFGWGFTLTGTAPNTAGQPWSGTYQLSNDGTTDSLCAFNGSGTFTATPVGQITGTFTGSATVASFASATASTGAPFGASLQLSASLVQGFAYSATGGTPVYSAQLLQGSLQIAGIPCFSHGVPFSSIPGVVEGNTFSVDMTMDDGSTVTLFGTIDNTLATHLLVNVLSVSGGKCAGNYSFAGPGAMLSR